MASEDETVYCVCRKPYDENEFMIECDVCKDWFHGSCVGVQEYQAIDIEIYHCPKCQHVHGPLVLKKRRNWHRHDYSEEDVEEKAVQTGTVVFIKELKNRTFPSADEIPVMRCHGSELSPEFLRQNGFHVPIIVEKKEGLGLVVPPAKFSIQDVENLVGSMREIDVIDVSKQEDYKMLMREWTEYYNSPNRSKIYNVISLEFSKTQLSELVIPPTLVRQLSWVSNVWPEQLPDDCTYTKPAVQKYCLMGVRESFTDFHIDFGGTSVWYHILRGEKVFYLIRPSQANLSLYENWLSSSNQSETFFGDQVDTCYKCVVKQGQTLFIPTGWIHAVFTPIDSLVFGGNFLHDLHIPLQLQVYEIEKRVKTPAKYLFPSFETTNWYAAKHILDLLKDYDEDNMRPPVHVLNGGKALASHLKSWTQRKDLNNLHLFVKDAKHDVPETIQYGRLLKDLSKACKNFDMLTKGSPVKLKIEKQKIEKPKEKQEKSVKSKKKKKNVPPKQMVNLDLLHQHTQEKLLEMQNEQKKNIYEFPDDDDDDSLPGSLKVRIPKAGAYIDPALKQEKKGSLKFEMTDMPLKQENVPPDGIVIESPLDSKAIAKGLKLKVSNGKIVSDMKKKGKGTKVGGKFQPLVGGDGEDADSDTDNLVVDENPQRGKKAAGSAKAASSKSASTLKPGSLKLKLSFLGKSAPPESSTSQESSQESDVTASQSDSESQGEDQANRANLPTIRGGLNGSIADILEASGYGTETDFKVDDDIGRAPSPSMRDAIQGMLSMSQMGGMELFSKGRGRRTIRLQQRSQLAMEEEEKLDSCYKDEEFVYPTLDLSDEEAEQIFKAQSKGSKDDTWNPKARVQVTIPKGDRPHREGVKKEAMEQVMAATAAKPAASLKPRRPKKRTKSESFSEGEGQGTSAGLSLSSSAPGSAFRPSLSSRPANPTPDSPTKPKKPRKGQATAKQRLGKILKMHKMKIF
ncbi:lysine-specific demethylase 7B-like isoform X1 [Pecten maximus]|uniref:lysine-specific demethylase 7B-like isoform X1 n=1 Tax=Pecten maximus TaxID=6579 RepID=UPI001457FCC8|nr:lysine-specific demethylase 7B-like isoform X1 [Pecten maximus]